MSIAHTNFVRCNLLSPVVRIGTGARHTTYHLADGDVHRLNKGDMERLSEFVTRTGYAIRLSAEMKARLGE